MDAQTFFETLNQYFDEHKIKEAGELLEKTLDEAREAGDIAFELSILSEMMGYYRSTNQKEKGLTSVADGLKIIQENGLGENPFIASMWINMGTTLCHFEHIDEAEICYKNAEKALSGQPQTALTMASFYNNSAAIYVKKGDFEEADAKYQFALKFLDEAEDDSQLWEDVLFNRLVTYLNIIVMNQTKLFQGRQDKDSNQQSFEGKEEQKMQISKLQNDSQQRFKQIGEILSDEKFRERPSFDFAITKCEQCFENLNLTDKLEWLKQYKKDA